MFAFTTCITLLLASFAQTLPTTISRSHALYARNTTNPSVYVCQNFDWAPPCLLIPLGSSENGQMNFWMAPAPGGPGPFQTSNYTVGSWGPSVGVTTYWEDNLENKSQPLTYPGTGQVDTYWQNEIWTWYPTWEA